MPARIQAVQSVQPVQNQQTAEASRSTEARHPVTVRVFAQRFSATPRGARLARLLALLQLDMWGVPYGSTASDDAGAIVAELAANAVTHGRVPGRDFRLGLALATYDGLRIEVTDTRDEARPSPVRETPSGPGPDPGPGPGPDPDPGPDPEAETGRGLFVVGALAAEWGVRDRLGGGPGKTVWARLAPGPLMPGTEGMPGAPEAP